MGQGAASTNWTRVRYQDQGSGQETQVPVKVSRPKSCSIYKLSPVYKHTKNWLITRGSPGLIFGISWYRIFFKKTIYRKNVIFLCIVWERLSSTFRLKSEIKFCEKEILWFPIIREVSYYSEISFRKKIFFFSAHLEKKLFSVQYVTCERFHVGFFRRNMMCKFCHVNRPFRNSKTFCRASENIYNWTYLIVLVEVLKLQYCSCRIAETSTAADETSTVAEL